MAGRILAALLHASSAFFMAYGFRKLDGLPISNWINKQKGGRFQFLTMQGLAVAWLTMIIGLLIDLGGRSRVLSRFKRALIMISLPVSLVISLVYWALILLRPSLILQAEKGGAASSTAMLAALRLPLAVDLCLHAVPAIAHLADFVLYERKYGHREVWFGAPAVTAVAAAWYVWWVEYCARHNGIFPYPFLTNNPFSIRLQIYLAGSIFALFLFWGVNAMHVRK